MARPDTPQGERTHAINPNQISLTRSYMEGRGPEVHKRYAHLPADPDTEISNVGTIDELRDVLRRLEMKRDISNSDKPPFARPIQVTVRGNLFPCGLLSSGWWQRLTRGRAPEPTWKSSVQRWNFIGFNEWAPSWDFSWGLDSWGKNGESDTSGFFAQFGDGDEGDSIPVYMSSDEARKVYENLQPWGGMTAKLTGILGYRSHFPSLGVKDAGGWLNYCFFVDPNRRDHGIRPQLNTEPFVYSGYLWKCVAPVAWIKSGKVGLDDVFFVWEHTDFSRPDAVRFSKDVLNSKERLLKKHINELSGSDKVVLLAKSSSHLEGNPLWDVHDMRELLDMNFVEVALQPSKTQKS